MTLERIELNTFNQMVNQGMIKLGGVCPRCKCVYLISGLKCLVCDYDGEEE